MATFLLLAVTIGIVSTVSEAKNTPCPRNQPQGQLNECVRDALQQAVPELVKGLPQYGLLTIDPLRVEAMEVAKGKGPVSVDLSFKNLDISGLKNAKIKSAVMDVKGYKLSFKFDVDGPLTLNGDYTVNGKVLVLPIQGTGKCNVTLVNPTLEVSDVTGKPVTKKGKIYAHINNVKLVVTNVQHVHYDLENLFNGNKQLGDNMNLVLNDNWKEVYDSMVVPVQVALGLAVRNIFDHLFKSIPYESFFP